MAIKDIVLPDGKRIVIDEWLHQPLYSTVEFAQADGISLRAFTYVPGGQIPRSSSMAQRQANDRDTNLSKRQGMPWDQSLIVYSTTYEIFALSDAGTYTTATSAAGLEAEAPAVSATNLKILQRFLMWDLVVGAGMRKPQYRSPFAYVGQSVGSPSWAAGDGLDPLGNIRWSSGTGGNIHALNQRKFELPIYIAQDQVFYLGIYAPTGTLSATNTGTSAGLNQDIRIRAYLDGMQRRPVA